MKTPTVEDAGRAESWWSSEPEGWPEVSESVYARWHRNERTKPKLDKEVALAALAFGYTSRFAFGEHRAWDDLVDQLEADWRKAGRQRANPWSTVRKAVKAGWTAAGAPPEQNRATSTSQPVSSADPLVGEPMQQVPGGRPDAPLLEPDRTEAADEEGETRVPGGRPDRRGA